MANRIIYQSESLFVGPSPATGRHFTLGTSGTNLVTGLYRVQSVSHDFSFERTNVNQYGELGAIDRPILNTPTVNLNISYLLANMWNERALGFVTNGNTSCLSGILSKNSDEKNYFIKTMAEGADSIDNAGTAANTIGFGNGYITSYTSQASVGGLPTVDIGVQALNMAIYAGASALSLPSVNPVDGQPTTGWIFTLPTAASSPGTGDLDISSLRPGDITLSFKERQAEDEGILTNATGTYQTLGVNLENANIQNYNISFNLNRETISKLGSRYAFSREPVFPLDVTCSVEAVVGDLTTGNLSSLINCDKSYDITIKLHRPDQCSPGTKPVIAQYNLRNAKLNSQSFSSSIGSNKTVTLEFGSQIGGPQQSTIGLFMSGISA